MGFPKAANRVHIHPMMGRDTRRYRLCQRFKQGIVCKSCWGNELKQRRQNIHVTADTVTCQRIFIEFSMMEHEDWRMEFPEGIFPSHE